MDKTEPNPVKTTDELLRLIRQEFPRLLTTVLERKRRDNLSAHPFVHVGPNGSPEQTVVTFLYQGGLAHALLDNDHGADFLAGHLELVYLCSEVHNRRFREHVQASPIVSDREEIEAPPETREQPLAAARLIVRACTSDPMAIHIEFHPE